MGLGDCSELNISPGLAKGKEKAIDYMQTENIER